MRLRGRNYLPFIIFCGSRHRYCGNCYSSVKMIRYYGNCFHCLNCGTKSWKNATENCWSGMSCCCAKMMKCCGMKSCHARVIQKSCRVMNYCCKCVSSNYVTMSHGMQRRFCLMTSCCVGSLLWMVLHICL